MCSVRSPSASLPRVLDGLLQPPSAVPSAVLPAGGTLATATTTTTAPAPTPAVILAAAVLALRRSDPSVGSRMRRACRFPKPACRPKQTRPAATPAALPQALSAVEAAPETPGSEPTPPMHVHRPPPFAVELVANYLEDSCCMSSPTAAACLLWKTGFGDAAGNVFSSYAPQISMGASNLYGDSRLEMLTNRHDNI
jgi:hypothetical protein